MGQSDDVKVALILEAVGRGNQHASAELLPLVYDELRRLAAHRLARESPGQTLDATALVHKGYLRLMGDVSDKPWECRRPIFGAAAKAMRRVLIDRARDRRRQKRGCGRQRMRIEFEAVLVEPPGDDFIALDDALEALAREDPAGAGLVSLRVFAGLTLAEAAEVLGIGRRPADRYWADARAWRCDALSDEGPNPIV